MAEEKKKNRGFFKRFKKGVSKTSKNLEAQIDALETEDAEDVEESLEEILITADVGVQTTIKLLEDLSRKVPWRHRNKPEHLKNYLKAEITDILSSQNCAIDFHRASPFVILVIGVNGAGKTTSIGKLAHQLGAQGHQVMIAAADTFRAGAIDQLEIWAQRSKATLIKHAPGADPSAVVFDATAACKKRGYDILLIDTAGRLHNKAYLMDELLKMKRVIEREIPGAPHETLLVLDANNGQNAVQQALEFDKLAKLSGIILTKLDSSSKGGVIINIVDQLKIPVKFIGVGEQLDDLDSFDPTEFADALFT